MEKIIEVLEMLGLRTIFGWNIVYQKMLLFAFCVFFSSPFFTRDEAFTTNGFGSFSNWKKAIDKI